MWSPTVKWPAPDEDAAYPPFVGRPKQSVFPTRITMAECIGAAKGACKYGVVVRAIGCSGMALVREWFSRSGA